MGKKMLLGLGAIALAALLTVNVGIATSNESTNALLTLKGLEAMAGDDVEGGGDGGGGHYHLKVCGCGGSAFHLWQACCCPGLEQTCSGKPCSATMVGC